MPFFEIPSDQLLHLSLFGYDLLPDEPESDSDFAWYSGPRGRTKINKKRPVVWLEDTGDAIQLKAIALIPSPSPPAR